LQRWVSADPLAIHVPGQADLNVYAYVNGRALIAVDPFGLESWLTAALQKVGVSKKDAQFATQVAHTVNPGMAAIDRAVEGGKEVVTKLKEGDRAGGAVAALNTVKDTTGVGTGGVEVGAKLVATGLRGAEAQVGLALGKGNPVKHLDALKDNALALSSVAIAGAAGAAAKLPFAGRASPAWLDGYMAELKVRGGEARVPLSSLESPKTAISADARYMRAKEGVAAGETPPIEVEPTGRGGYRIQDGVRRSVAARELGHGDINATVREPTPGAPQTVPLDDVKLEK
jgi:hypothetical protein